MRAIPATNTAPELRLRRALWANGIRFRTCKSNLPGKPDVVISSKKVAIFVDGEFWHGRQWQRGKHISLDDQFARVKTNGYWLSKIRGNMDRDCRVTHLLLSSGWTVLRFWESQINNTLETCIKTVLKTVGSGRRRKTTAPAVIPQKTVAEFFAGIGLMRMGLEKSGWTVAFANDMDPQKFEMYSAQFPDAESHYSLDDVHNLAKDPSNIPTVSLATASFPCNDLSVAGSMDGLNGKQSSAFWGFVEVLRGMHERKPPIVLLENVVGFLMSHNGDDFRQALSALNSLGYSVDAFIINAAYFVPQSRQRLFVVGTLRPPLDQSVTDFSLDPDAEARPALLSKFIRAHPEIKWRIQPLPTFPQHQNCLEDILEDLPDSDPHWWSAERADYLFNQMSPKHRKIAEHMIHGKKWTYGAVFRRVRKGKSMGELRVDGLAGCLRTPRGGSGRQILFKAGKGKYFARLITAREAARLMGANDFKLTVPLNQALFGFGDAVCVPVITWIAENYLNPVTAEMMHGIALKR